MKILTIETLIHKRDTCRDIQNKMSLKIAKDQR